MAGLGFSRLELAVEHTAFCAGPRFVAEFVVIVADIIFNVCVVVVVVGALRVIETTSIVAVAVAAVAAASGGLLVVVVVPAGAVFRSAARL